MEDWKNEDIADGNTGIRKGVDGIWLYELIWNMIKLAMISETSNWKCHV